MLDWACQPIWGHKTENLIVHALAVAKLPLMHARHANHSDANQVVAEARHIQSGIRRPVRAAPTTALELTSFLQQALRGLAATALQQMLELMPSALQLIMKLSAAALWLSQGLMQARQQGTVGLLPTALQLKQQPPLQHQLSQL